MIGNNACGSRALGYGRTADNVEALTVLLADGSVSRSVKLGAPTAQPRAAAVMHELVDKHLGTVRTEFGRFGRQVSGYSFEHLLPEGGRRLDRFLVGTEGTLGVVLDATVRLVEDARAGAGRARLPDDGRRRGRRTCAAGADGHWSRARASTSASRGQVRGHPELPDGRRLALRRGHRGRRGRGRVAGRGRWRPRPACRTGSSTDTLEQLALWRIREDGAGLAARSLTRPAQAGWEDAAVPPAKLGAYLRDFDALLKDRGLDGVPYGHFGDGCVHVRIDFELEDPAAGGGSGTSSRTPRTWWRRTAARCRASTVTGGPAPSCCRGCTPRRRSR